PRRAPSCESSEGAHPNAALARIQAALLRVTRSPPKQGSAAAGGQKQQTKRAHVPSYANPTKVTIQISRRPAKRAIGEGNTADYDPAQCSSCWRQEPLSQAVPCCRRPTRGCSPSAKTICEARSTTIRSAPAGCWS